MPDQSDHGSKPRYANILVKGVPTGGVIDTGADITIINGALFVKITAAARQRKVFDLRIRYHALIARSVLS